MHFTQKVIIKAGAFISDNKWLGLLVKTGVASLLLLVLYFELTSRNNLQQIWDTFLHQLHGANVLWLLLATLLMPLNWMAETEKWHQFIAKFQPFSRRKALLAVFTGVTFSLFTPNRVGEYGGRILYVRPENQWFAVVANLIGNFCQYMVLLGMGAIGSIWILSHFQIVEATSGIAVVLFATLGFVFMLWIYFKLDLVIIWLKTRLPQLKKIPYLNKIRVELFLRFTRKERAEILGWAAVRYAIYSSQYFFLLRFFNINPGIVEGFSGIFSLYLLQTSLPLPPLTGLVARGNLAVFLWGYFDANELAALAATFSLWVINLVIPAFIGTVSLFYVNISKSVNYKNEPAPNLPKIFPGASSIFDRGSSWHRPKKRTH